MDVHKIRYRMFGKVNQNILCNIVNLKAMILAELQREHCVVPCLQGSGDVKYHLGACTELPDHATGKKIKIAVVANPSHLEGMCHALTPF